MGSLLSWSSRSPITAYRVYKNCRFAEYVSGWSGYKSSHISATIASVRSKFSTEVPKTLYFHNPVLTQKIFSLTYGPFSRGRSHNNIYFVVVLYCKMQVPLGEVFIKERVVLNNISCQKCSLKVPAMASLSRITCAYIHCSLIFEDYGPVQLSNQEGRNIKMLNSQGLP